MNRKSGGLAGGGFIRTEGQALAYGRLWRSGLLRSLAGLHTLHVFARFWAVRTVLGNLQVCRRGEALGNGG